MSTPIPQMSKDELRAEAAVTLRAVLQQTRVVGALRKRMVALEAALLEGPHKMIPAEGIPQADGGVLKIHRPTSGRSFVVKEKVDERAGELPAELQPVHDKEIKAMLSNLPPALGAELLTLATEDPEDTPVQVTEKAKYPTVAALRKAFGDENVYVGKPAKDPHIVLEYPGFTEDAPIILSLDGIQEQK